MRDHLTRLGIALCAALSLPSCVPEAQGQSVAPAAVDPIRLPLDYVPDGAYIDKSECDDIGGAFGMDGLGIGYCSLGRVLRNYACGSSRFISVIETRDGRYILRSSDHPYVFASRDQRQADTRYIADDMTLSVTKNRATLTRGALVQDCHPL